MIFDIRPVKNHESYYNRKSRYGINIQIISDWEGRIRFLFTGFPASVHDSRCIRNSPIVAEKERFFHGQEYILADSAYSLSETIITPFKKPIGNAQPYKAFNRALSSVRVRVEHCIGRLKGRFQSIRGMRALISKGEDNKRANRWLSACAILHNILIDIDNWEEMDLTQNLADALETGDEGTGKKAAAKRTKIMNIVLEMN